MTKINSCHQVLNLTRSGENATGYDLFCFWTWGILTTSVKSGQIPIQHMSTSEEFLCRPDFRFTVVFFHDFVGH